MSGPALERDRHAAVERWPHLAILWPVCREIDRRYNQGAGDPR